MAPAATPYETTTSWGGSSRDSVGSEPFYKSDRDYRPAAPTMQGYERTAPVAVTYGTSTTVTSDRTTSGERASDGFDRWMTHQDLWFEAGSFELSTSEIAKILVLADHMYANPAHTLGLDGSLPAVSAEGATLELAARRVQAVRDALIQAGVPSTRIQQGAFGHPGLRTDRRVEVLMVNTTDAARALHAR